MRTLAVLAVLCSATVLAACQDAPPPRWDWNATGDLQGWGREKSLAPPIVEGGVLHTQLTGTDPWIMGSAIRVDAARYAFLRLRIRVSHFGSGSIYWATEAAPAFSQAKMASFRLESDTEFTECLLDLRDHPEWQGTITQLRLDPIDLYASAVDGQQVEVDYLHFVADEERPPEVTVGQPEGPPTALTTELEPFELKLPIDNTGGQAAEGLEAILRVPEGSATVSVPEPHPTMLAPGEQATLRWTVAPERVGTLPTAVTVRFANHPSVYAALRTLVMPSGPMEQALQLSLGDAALVVPTFGGRGAPALLQPETDNGQAAFAMPMAGVLLYLDDGDVLNAWELAGHTPPRATLNVQREPAGLVARVREGIESPFTGEMEIGETDTPGLLRMAHGVRCSADTRVMAFWGPMVYVGEPAGETGKQDAIFPGLEWLVGEEASSSDLDVHGPDQFRYVPHPNKVTVGAMGVRANGKLVGLLWDPRQEWAPGHDRPSALFAVPNTLHGQAHNLLGLLAPSVPEFLSENGTLAAQSFLLKAEQSIQLESYLVYRDADSSADIVLDWIDLFGLPDPVPSPRPELTEALQFTLRGYTESLWVPEENGWRNGLGPPTGVGAFWPFMRDMTVAGRVLPEGELRTQVREQARLARGDVEGNFGLDTAVYDGGLIRLANVRLRRGAESLIGSQGEDGGWGFQPDPNQRAGQHDPFILGEPGQVELGTCARNALTLLRFARVTQDAATREAGLKALRRMAQFDVPRAAQVWEVSVHTPDVLAAAQAVRAFLEGYRLTGDGEWLAESVRWAKLGLPFIYLWDSGEYPYMRYGSVPVFGATWYTGAWFGRLVQWNGSDYAAALLELAEFDDSLPWRRIAEGLVSSAAHQQSDEPPHRGLYTDASNLMNGSVSDFWVAPYHHCECLLSLMGVPVEPDTRVVEVGHRRAAITSAGKVTEAAFGAGALSVTCEFPDEGRHYVLVANCPAVASVTLNGADCTQVEDVLDAEGSAWMYDLGAEMVEIRVETGAQARIAMTLAG